MSSKYNRRRKVQPAPDFCYSKKPGRLDILPCPDGPAIGPHPYVVFTISKFGAALPETRIITAQSNQTTPGADYDAYGGPATDPDFFFEFNFDCQRRTWTWAIVDLKGEFPAPNTWGESEIPYTGGKQLDTGAVNAANPNQPSNWLVTIRFQL